MFHADRKLFIDRTVQISWYARRLADVAPNPWHAGRIAGRLVERLRSAGQSDDDIFNRRSYLSYALRKHVANAVEEQAEAVFKRKLSAGDIQFSLQAGEPNFHMVDCYEIPIPVNSRALLERNDLKHIQLSLFEPVLKSQFDSALESNFARYLVEQKAL